MPLEFDTEPTPATRPIPIQRQTPVDQQARAQQQAELDRQARLRQQARAQQQAQLQQPARRAQAQPLPQAPVEASPRTRPLTVQRQVVRTSPAEPLVLTRPLPVQRPAEIARITVAAAPSRRQPRTSRRARRAVKRVLKAPTTGPIPVQTVAPRRSRHGLRALLAAIGVLGLTAVTGLPAFAAAASEPAPPPGAYSDDDVQAYQAGAGAGAGTSDVGSYGSVVAPTWISPVAGHLGDPFGPRPIQPVAGTSLFHRGQDIVAPCGTPIHAAADGVVQTATWWGTYGNWVLIDNGNGIATGYAHQSRMLVTPGQHVQAGQVIGLVGETGAATGCHLHLEVHLNGVAINPVPFFTAKGVTLGS